MKRISMRVISVLLSLTALLFCMPTVGTAAGFTIVSDAETAVEKNKQLLMDMLDSEEISADFTQDQLEEMIFKASKYSTDESTGMGYIVNKFRVKKPTSSAPGYVSAEVLIYLDDAEDGFELKVEIPASGDSADDETDYTDDINDTQDDDNKNSDLQIDSTSAKKEIEAASKAINAAMFDFEVSNATTAKDILNMAKNALPDGSHVTVSLDRSDFSLIKSTNSVNGTVSAALELKCGTESKRIPVAKTIEPEPTDNYKKLDEDWSSIGKAISAMDISNRVTDDDIIKVAVSAAKNGSSVKWQKEYYKEKATVYGDGKIFGYLIVSLGGDEKELYINEKIPRINCKIPTDKLSVNSEEWDVLRRTNIERAKVGDALLSMAGDLQSACNIREVETQTLFSHTRPDGTMFNTAIPSTFKCKGSGENIYSCPTGDAYSEKAMTAWMNSKGHRENIQRSGYDYIGIGMTDYTAVQIFAICENPVVSVASSSGSMNFEDEDAMLKEYLICRTSDGLESYLPLDPSAMTKTATGYKMNIRSTIPVEFTVGTVSEGDSVTDKTTPSTDENVSFIDVAANAYYANAVKWAVDRKITTGTSKTEFSPDITCTRAQILTFLYRAVGSPKPEIKNPFSDVSESDYYYNAALWASENGMVDGKVFGADTPCTRASTVIYLWKNAGSPDKEASDKFSDVSKNAECAAAVTWALENNVTSGTSETTFSPDDICSRGQIVTFLNRAIK